MEIVLNRTFGCYSLTTMAKEEMKKLGIGANRTDPNFIQFVKDKGSDYCCDGYGKLEIFELPDGVTDYAVDDCDGFESIVYVLDGKLHYI